MSGAVDGGGKARVVVQTGQVAVAVSHAEKFNDGIDI